MSRARNLPIPVALAVLLVSLGGTMALAGSRYDRIHTTDGPRSTPDVMTWHLDPAGSRDRVQLTFELAWTAGGRNVTSDEIASGRLEGFGRSLLDGAKHEAAITLRRAPGTFRLSGYFDHGHGLGTFAFEADPAFASELEHRGIGRPTFDQQLELAIDDCDLALLDALRESGYRGFDVAALVRVSEHGVTAEYVSGLARGGYRPADVAELVAARDHDVSLEYLREMKEAGFGSAEIAAIIRARDHGVDAGYAHELSTAGYGHQTLDALIRARDHGVDAAYAGELAAAGYGRAPLEDLIRAHDHGVDGRFVRKARERYGDDVSLERVIQLHDRGMRGD